MVISTKKGDGGRTRLLSGEEVSKNDPRTSAYGVLDEAVSAIGLGRALSRDGRVRSELLAIQETCFLIGAELATVPAAAQSLPGRVGQEHLDELEALGARLEEQVELDPKFIVPGATAASAAIDLARTIVRRLERDVVSLVQEESDIPGNPCMLPYLNRLSDVLFLLARCEEKQQGVDLEYRKD